MPISPSSGSPTKGLPWSLSMAEGLPGAAPTGNTRCTTTSPSRCSRIKSTLYSGHSKYECDWAADALNPILETDYASLSAAQKLPGYVASQASAVRKPPPTCNECCTISTMRMSAIGTATSARASPRFSREPSG